MIENRWKRGSCKCTGFKTFDSNPSIALALDVSSAVRALNTSVSEVEMSPYRVSLREVKDKVGSSFRVGWSPCMKVKRDYKVFSGEGQVLLVEFVSTRLSAFPLVCVG